mgnify:CR=1 FL=1
MDRRCQRYHAAGTDLDLNRANEELGMNLTEEQKTTGRAKFSQSGCRGAGHSLRL